MGARAHVGGKMANRILTTHVGALPTPKKLVELAHKRSLGEQFDKAAYDREIKDGVNDIVRHQKQVGVDLVNDGELPHNVGWAWDYGAWWSYVIPRLDGVLAVNSGLWGSTLSAQTKTPMTPNDFVVSDWESAGTWPSSRRPTWTP